MRLPNQAPLRYYSIFYIQYLIQIQESQIPLISDFSSDFRYSCFAAMRLHGYTSSYPDSCNQRGNIIMKLVHVSGHPVGTCGSWTVNDFYCVLFLDLLSKQASSGIVVCPYCKLYFYRTRLLVVIVVLFCCLQSYRTRLGIYSVVLCLILTIDVTHVSLSNKAQKWEFENKNTINRTSNFSKITGKDQNLNTHILLISLIWQSFKKKSVHLFVAE